MATPRKYPTLDEFEELKEAVAAHRGAAVQQAREVVRNRRRRGGVRAHRDRGRVRNARSRWATRSARWRAAPDARFARSSCARRPDPARPPLHAACADGSSVTAVDMRLPGHVVIKGHGVKPWPQTIAGGNPWQERPPSKRKDTTCKPSKPNLATISRMRRQKPRLLA